MPDNNYTNTQIIDWVVKGIVGVMVPLFIWALSLIGSITAAQSEMDTRVSVIEANRFTNEDGYSLERALDAKLDAAVADIKVCLNKIQRGEVCD